MLLNYSLITVWLLWWAGWLLVGFSANPNKRRESITDRLYHLTPMVIGICVLFAPMFIGHENSFEWEEGDKWLISSLVIIGLGITCWARYHLGKQWSGLVTTKVGHELVTSGPYKYVRHPIYSGIVLAIVGSALAVNTPYALLGAAIWISTYVIKLHHEEMLLSKQFGLVWMRQCDLVYDKLIPGVY